MVTNRFKRHKRIRGKVHGTEARPRLAVFRSNKNIQIQLIDDEKRVTLLGMTTKHVDDAKATKSDKARKLGVMFGKKVLELENGKYSAIVFDRGGYRYHGRVKAVAEGLRESGLSF
jgi:large subunit ribosomal protein L18